MSADMNAIAAEAEKNQASSPVVIEMHTEERVVWLLSFGGSNPTDDQCIELTKEQCFWLKNKLASSNYVPLQPAPDTQALVNAAVADALDESFGLLEACKNAMKEDMKEPSIECNWQFMIDAIDKLKAKYNL